MNQTDQILHKHEYNTETQTLAIHKVYSRKQVNNNVSNKQHNFLCVFVQT